MAPFQVQGGDLRNVETYSHPGVDRILSLKKNHDKLLVYPIYLRQDDCKHKWPEVFETDHWRLLEVSRPVNRGFLRLPLLYHPHSKIRSGQDRPASLWNGGGIEGGILGLIRSTGPTDLLHGPK